MNIRTLVTFGTKQHHVIDLVCAHQHCASDPNPDLPSVQFDGRSNRLSVRTDYRTVCGQTDNTKKSFKTAGKVFLGLDKVRRVTLCWWAHTRSLLSLTWCCFVFSPKVLASEYSGRSILDSTPEKNRGLVFQQVQYFIESRLKSVQHDSKMGDSDGDAKLCFGWVGIHMHTCTHTHACKYTWINIPT